MARCAAAGLHTIALTDHDNLDGVDQARRAATEAGIGFISGTELSVDWETGAMHMLVYFLEPGEGPLQGALASVRRGRENRNREMVESLRGLGVDISYEEVVTEAGGTGVGRPHFAAVLVAKGYAEDIRDAFDRHLAAGRPGYVPRTRLRATEAIDMARASGGVPVIAHPHTVALSSGDYSTAFETLVDAGLGGIEAYYSEYEPARRKHLADICARLGIVPTGGSDYHGAYKPGIAVGSGRGDLVVPDEVVELLHEERAKGTG